MPPQSDKVRVAILGASSLRGKDLKECLAEGRIRGLEIRLFDEEFAAGTLTEAAGEAAVIKLVDEESFNDTRFVFLTGSPEFAGLHWRAASNAGATVIDVSGSLAAEPDAIPWIPALNSAQTFQTESGASREAKNLFLVPSAPADIAISIHSAFASRELELLVFTFFQPVSEHGLEGIEELEGQVAKLLSLAPIPQAVFDTQVAFNMLSEYGEESGGKLRDVRAHIQTEVRRYLGRSVRIPVIAVVHAPVFHANAFTAYAQFKPRVGLDEITELLVNAGLKVSGLDEQPPTNVSVAGESRPVLGHPEYEAGNERGIWLWGAADNLRVPSATAVAIAEALLAR